MNLKRALHCYSSQESSRLGDTLVSYLNGRSASVIVVVVVPLEDWLRCTFPGDEEG